MVFLTLEIYISYMYSYENVHIDAHMKEKVVLFVN